MAHTVWAKVIKLSGDMPSFGDVKDFLLTPDGKYVIYRADQNIEGVYELFSVPVDGSSLPVQLNALLPSGSQVENDYQISPDSQWVVYRAPQDTTGMIELYAVPITGPYWESFKLNDALTPGGNVLGFQISQDSSRVVYRADREEDTLVELYSVALSPTAEARQVIKLNGALVADGDVSGLFLISPDSQWVVYRADQESDEVYELYSVPINGPASAGVKLNGTLVEEGDVLAEDFTISPDSQWVVYVADQQSDEVFEIFSVPIGGPASSGVRLNGPLASGGDVSTEFHISSDSSRVVYVADQQMDEVFGIYSVPIGGPSSAGVILNEPLVKNGKIATGFRISPDGNWVVYGADQERDDVVELFSVPITGPSNAGMKLNKALPEEGDVFTDFVISPDSQQVVYRADQETEGMVELYSVPIAGPSSAGVKLNKPLPAQGDVQSGFMITPTGERVVYRADQEEDGVIELFSVPINGPASTGVKLNDTLAVGGTVFSQIAIVPDGSQAVYRADQETDGVSELFASDIEALVTFGVGAAMVTEDSGAVGLQVNLLNATGEVTVTVDYEVSGGTATGGGVDYLLDGGTLTFSPGAVSQTIVVQIVDDALDEPLETVQISLLNPQNASLGAVTTFELMIAEEVFRVQLPFVRKD